MVGAALIAFLTWRADLGSVLGSLGEARFGYVILAYFFVLAALVLGALRWRPYLHELGFEISVRAAIRLCLIGAFFNAFLPTGVGGDTYKALRLPRNPGTSTNAFASVLLDRAAGVVGMAVLALIGVVSQMVNGGSDAVLVSALSVGVFVFLTYGALPFLGGRTSSTISPTVGAGIRGRFVLLVRAISAGARHSRTSARGLTMGVVTGVMFLAANASLAQALNLSVPLGTMSALLLLASVVAVLPLSINGVGLRETAYVWGLGSYGIGQNTALAFALLVLGTGLASSAVGGIVYAATGGRRLFNARV